MAKAMSLKPVAYVLDFEKNAPKEEQTVFNIRPLTFSERAEVEDAGLATEMNMLGPKNQHSMQTIRHLSGTQNKMAVERGLVSIQNLKGDDGSLLKYEIETDPVHKTNVLNSLPPEWIVELSKRILVMSGLRKEEEKN